MNDLQSVHVVEQYNPAAIDDEVTPMFAPGFWRNRCQRLLWWLVMRSMFFVRKRTLTTVNISGDDIVDKLHMSSRDLQRIYDREAAWLIVGKDVYYELFMVIEARFSPFSAEMNLWITSGQPREARIIGIKIICLPYITGWALIPDLTKER